MPYADPEKQREANRVAQSRARARKRALGTLVKPPADVSPSEPPPEAPSRDEMLRALGVQARKGNVPAIRLLLEEYRRDGDSDSKPTEGAIDELAGRRAERAI